jgi:D-beta-D-heptose 7-phosphate kinase/D-beta-D-heptose 1-phosphate adenosyltransferase
MAVPDVARLEKIVGRIAEVRLLVVGDVVLDQYVMGDVERVSPEAPVPVVRVRDESYALGGAVNVARNVTALGARAFVSSVVGDDSAGDRVTALLESFGVDSSNLVVSKGRPTTIKTRVVARGQQIVRLDREIVEAPPREVLRRLAMNVERSLPGAHGAILEDYGKGVLSPQFAAALMRGFVRAEIPVIVDPKGMLAPYRGAALLKPNLREAGALSGVEIHDRSDLEVAAVRMHEQFGGGDIVVTCGADGMVLFEDGGAGVDVPTVSQEVFDVQGAGDTSVAALALSRLAGASLFEATVIANAAAGVVVAKVGTATASAREVLDRLPYAVAALGDSR